MPIAAGSGVVQFRPAHRLLFPTPMPCRRARKLVPADLFARRASKNYTSSHGFTLARLAGSACLPDLLTSPSQRRRQPAPRRCVRISAPQPALAARAAVDSHTGVLLTNHPVRPVHFGVARCQAATSASDPHPSCYKKSLLPCRCLVPPHIAISQSHTMARVPGGTPLAALLFLSLLSSCRAAAGSGANPTAVVLPVSKDATATQQYVTAFRQRTPLVPVKAVLDLAGATLWVDCDAGHYASSTYRRVPCGSKPCRLFSHSAACATSCSGPPSPSCLNDTCGGFPENTATHVSTSGNVITDVLALPTTFRPAPGPLAAAPAFLFTCGATSLTRGLAAGASGMASLSRARFALPTQLAATFRFARKFALCLPPDGAAGVVVFGDAAPYGFQPGFTLSNASLIYTPLLVNPVSTAGVSTKGDKSDEYFVGVTGIKVNGRAVPGLNATLLAIDRKSGVGGAKLSTVAPYTVLESSIHKAVTDAFAAETTMIPRVSPVAPFKLCYDGSKVGSTRVGPAVPTIELVFGGNDATSWVVFGANSMVATKGGALCLGVVDGGKEPRTSVVIGGHMMEDNLLEFDLEASRLGFSSSLLFRQTNCNNFRLG
ncbi:hypothetical protein HU200_008178 [Digitaria exilis]|uniref:Peptidase A1 domain-containing protein n=1 Tax=Digitaria exilis TaxID=1010633 RepID=A0A835FP39_9POAL|nr:hypothetical protein HU200_008178 [Digitaria exilis]